MGQVIVDLTGDASRLQKAYSVAEGADKGLRDSLAATGKVGQSSAEMIEREFNQAGDKSSKAFNTMLRELKKTGPEGKKVAGELESHLRDTGKAGRKSMDSILQSLNQLDPAAAEVAGRIKGELAEADQRSEFDQTLASLKSMGPEGRKVAGEVESHLRASGKVGRQSMESMIAKLRELDPEAADAAAAMQKHITDEATVIDAKLVKMASPLDQLKVKAGKVFGAQGMADLKAYGGALGMVGGAVGLVGEMFEQLEEKQTSALDSLTGQADPERRLVQIAKSAEDLDMMLAQADKMSLKFGMPRQESRNLMFSARSEGFAEDVGKIARFDQVIDVEAQAPLAGSLGRLFPQEGLSVEQRLSGVLTAAQTSAFDFETVGAGVRKSSAASMGAGSDMAETLAANATLANLIGETAGDRVKSFADKLSRDKQFGGSGIIAGVRSLAAAPEEERSKFLGDSQEVNEAFRLLNQELPALVKMATAVREDIKSTGSGGGMLLKQVGIAEQSDRFQMRMMVRRSEVAKEFAEEQRYADSAAALAAGKNNLQADMVSRGVGEMNQTLMNTPLSDVPLIGPVVTTLLPDWSFAEGSMKLGRQVGIDPGTTAAAMGEVSAANDFSASRSGGLPRKIMERVDMFGGVRAAGAIFDATTDRESVSDRMIGELSAGIREQNDLQRQSLAANQQTAANTAPKASPKSPPNYAAGLDSAATSAAMP